MQSSASTVESYLAELSEERREIITAVRKVILENIDPLYQEGMAYGMLGWSIPHSVYPPGYHCNPQQPLPFAGLASQKQAVSLYLMGLYIGSNEELEWFQSAWKATGKKLDMGKSCVRFKKLSDVPLDVVGESIRRIPARLYIERYEIGLSRLKKGASKAKG